MSVFLAVLGLRCCAWTFSSCSERALGCVGFGSSSTQAQQLCFMDLIALQHVGSSQTRDQTHVAYTGRCILNHCATREVPGEASLLIRSTKHFTTIVLYIDSTFD